MSFVIATNSRRRNEILVMVDRSKQRRSFWSNRTTDAFIYADRSAAEHKAASLRYNAPRVLSLAEARRLSKNDQLERARELDRIYEAGMDCTESGWDGHK